MSDEPRTPPRQFIARLRRALGGRAGWGGFALQIVFVAAVAWIGYEIVANARANLQAQRITSGFGFLSNTAGFDGHRRCRFFEVSGLEGRTEFRPCSRAG